MQIKRNKLIREGTTQIINSAANRVPISFPLGTNGAGRGYVICDFSCFDPWKIQTRLLLTHCVVVYYIFFCHLTFLTLTALGGGGPRRPPLDKFCRARKNRRAFSHAASVRTFSFCVQNKLWQSEFFILACKSVILSSFCFGSTVV